MAYGVKYRTTIHRPFIINSYGNPIVTVDILKNSYEGAITTLITEKDSCQITVDPEFYFIPIRPRSFSMRIINNFANFFELDDLFIAGNFEYKIKVYDSAYTFFEGYIPCDVVEQKYLEKSSIIIHGTDNLKYLSKTKPTAFSLNTSVRIIDAIEHCLSFTGLELPIYINCNWGSPAIYFEKYINSDLFLEDDAEYKDCFYIIENILKSANCMIYYHNGIWYIEREKDRADSPRSYITYAFNGESGEQEEVAWEGDLLNTEYFNFLDTRQTISYIPGKKRIKIELDEKKKNNLVPYFYNDIQRVDWNVSLPYVIPVNGYTALLKWYFFDETTLYEDKLYPNYKIDTVYFSNNYIPSYNSTFTDNPTVVDFIRATFGTWKQQADLAKSSLYGLYTPIRFSLNEETDTTVNVKGIFTLPQVFLDIVMNNGKTIQQDMLISPKNHKFYARCFIKGSQTTIQTIFPFDAYQLFVNKDPDAGFIMLSKTIPTGAVQQYVDYELLPSVFYVEIPFDSFTDKSNFSTEFTCSITVKRAFLDSWIMNNDVWVVGVAEVGYSNEINTIGKIWNPGFPYDRFADSDEIVWGIKHSIFSDIIVSVNNKEENNVVYGDMLVTDFVEEYTDNLLIYSGISFNILNILSNTENLMYLVDRVFDIGDEELADALPIAQKVIRERFQAFNKTRRKITCDLRYRGQECLRIFQFLYDTNIDKKLSINGYTWKIESDTYENLELLEYVATDNIS